MGSSYKKKKLSVRFFSNQNRFFQARKESGCLDSPAILPTCASRHGGKLILLAPSLGAKRRREIHSSQSHSESVFTLDPDLPFNSSLQQNRSTCLILYLTIIPRVRVGYEMVVISYPTSTSGIIVLLKTPTKYRELFPTLFVKTSDF